MRSFAEAVNTEIIFLVPVFDHIHKDLSYLLHVLLLRVVLEDICSQPKGSVENFRETSQSI